MMKRNIKYMVLGLVALVATSCSDYLEINENPNSATNATPDLVLPAAITQTAANQVAFNAYGGEAGGFIANAGGFSGFGPIINYNYTNGTYTGTWASTYDNLNDYNYVLKQTEGSDENAYYNAAARIMMAYNYQKLVDTYNDVPYTDALKGAEMLTPKYDKGSDIYQSLVDQLDQAIATINTAQFPASMADPMFGGDMNQWKRFANTLKLRMLIRISGVPALQSFVTSKFAALDQTIGFLTTDAIVNPGYTKQDGKQNPMWNTYAYTVAGSLAGQASSRIPTKFAFGFYNGNKLTDSWRGSVIYKNFSSTSAPTPTNQLGNETNAPSVIANYSSWYTGTRNSASDITNALGVLKGASMGMPIMLAAESHFLQAEAYMKGLLAGGSAATSFDNGITASFTYLYKTVANTVDASKNVATDVAAYKAANSGSYLVNYGLAASDEQRLEAIITQKYIALNMVTNDEAWNEFRRTAYPKSVVGGTAFTSMASFVSNSSRPDKLPARIMYPTSEHQLNPSNVPSGINQFTSLIFWDAN